MPFFIGFFFFLVGLVWGNGEGALEGRIASREMRRRSSSSSHLSWGFSVESCYYGFSNPPISPTFSKNKKLGAFAADAPNGSSHNKKSKKKKTFAELREEEDLLLKERVTLKRELASLHVTFKEQKARSENLKRFKIDLNLQTSGGEVCGATGDRQVVGPRNKCSQMEVSTCDHAHSSGSSRGVEKDVDLQRRSCFVLPDLNMTPSEEDFGPEVLHASR